MDAVPPTMLITGASQGLGRVLAVHFARRGARLVLTARNEAGLIETAALTGGASRCVAVPADLARADSLEALARRLEALDVAVDVLVNNAADVTSKPLLETSPDEIDHLVRTNVTGLLWLTRLLAPAMVARGRGLIVNVSSLAGYKPNPAQTVYSITKAAVNAASRALRAELGPRGIHVMNVALPGIGHGAGQVAPERYAARLEAAMARRSPELFLSRTSRWLMRAYAAFPWLASLR